MDWTGLTFWNSRLDWIWKIDPCPRCPTLDCTDMMWPNRIRVEYSPRRMHTTGYICTCRRSKPSRSRGLRILRSWKTQPPTKMTLHVDIAEWFWISISECYAKLPPTKNAIAAKSTIYACLLLCFRKQQMQQSERQKAYGNIRIFPPPKWENNLPPSVRDCKSLTAFRRNLETHCFQSAFITTRRSSQRTDSKNKKLAI